MPYCQRHAKSLARNMVDVLLECMYESMRAAKLYTATVAECGTIAVAQSHSLPIEHFASNEYFGTNHVCSPHGACDLIRTQTFKYK